MHLVGVGTGSGMTGAAATISNFAWSLTGNSRFVVVSYSLGAGLLMMFTCFGFR